MLTLSHVHDRVPITQYETRDGRRWTLNGVPVAPPVDDCPNCGRAPADPDGCACDYCRGYVHRP